MVQTHPEESLVKALEHNTASHVVPEVSEISSGNPAERIRFLGFRDNRLESLFQEYLRRVRRGCSGRGALLAFIFDAYAVLCCVLQWSASLLPCLGIFVALALVSLALAILLHYRPNIVTGTTGPYLLWAWLVGQHLAFIALNPHDASPNAQLAWHLVLVYHTWVMMPLTALPCVALACCQCLCYSLLVSLLTCTSSHFGFFKADFAYIVSI